MTRYALRVLPTYPWDPAHIGWTSTPYDTREDAEEIRRAMPNGSHYEVIEIADQAEVTR